MQPVEVEQRVPELGVALVNVHRKDWAEFQRKYGKGNVSARIRELVREDIKSE